MNLDRIPKAGTTNARKAFWDSVREVVLASKKLAGKNVSVREHEGMGTLIDVASDNRGPSVPTGACCTDGSCTITTESACVAGGGHYLGNGRPCGGVDCTQGACCAADGSCTLTTLEECTGTFQGYGTVCDPNPCIGACCFGDFTCADDMTAADCADAGGTFQGLATTCTPNPCCTSICSDWHDFIGSTDGRRWKTRTLVTTITTAVTGPDGYFCNLSWNTTTIGRIDPDTCELSIECSGSIEWTGSESPFSISETWTHATGGCQRIPLDSIPGCAGDVGACTLGVNEVPPWPDHSGWDSVTALVATVTGSSHGSGDGYTWDCDASTTDTLTNEMFSPCEEFAPPP